jgi:hypothetical protein
MKKRKLIKLSRIERAILALAQHIELTPLCEYAVREEILDILGIEEIRPIKNTPRK